MTTDPENLDDLAEMLERSKRFRVLRRLPDTPTLQAPVAGEPVFRAAIIDTETTGVNLDTDQIIELAIVRFEYGAHSARIVGLLNEFEGLQQPSRPLSKAVAKITGLSDEILQGHYIDADAVAAQLASVDLCLAHNASFDRRIVERAFPTVPIRPWACTMTEVDWAAQGAAGRRQSDLLAMFGLFSAAHRAGADARALLHLLSLPLPATGEPMLAALLAAARRPSVVIIADGAPYDASPKLRARGYRWSAAKPKAWWREISAEALIDETNYLYSEIYTTGHGLPLAAIISASEQFRPLNQLLAKLAPASAVIARKNFAEPLAPPTD